MALFLVGDATDEIIASFPPSIMNRPTERMSIVAQRLLGENEEFLVYRWSLPSETGKTAVSPTSQGLPSFFKPVGDSSLHVGETSPDSSLHVGETSPDSSLQSSLLTVPKDSTTVSSSPPASVIEPDYRAAAPLPTSTSTAVPYTSTTSVSTSVPSVPTSTPLMCNQCNAGPFANELALVGHKTTAHAKKTTRRLKKPAVELGSTSTPPIATASTPPLPTASTPPVFTASPEQATLPTDVKPSQTEAQAPTVGSTVVGTLPTGPKEAPKEEELKAVEGASLPSIKYTKLSGLVGKPLEDFKAHFAANFPKDDMVKALEACHCSIVDNKIVFTGG